LYSDEERSRDGVGSCLKEVTGKRWQRSSYTAARPFRKLHSFLPSFLTLVSTSLLRTICDEANNRCDKSGEALRFHDKAAWSLYCGSSNTRAKKRPQKWRRRSGTQTLVNDIHKAWYYQANGVIERQKRKRKRKQRSQNCSRRSSTFFHYHWLLRKVRSTLRPMRQNWKLTWLEAAAGQTAVRFLRS
jgi:hypothetical protein